MRLLLPFVTVRLLPALATPQPAISNLRTPASRPEGVFHLLTGIFQIGLRLIPLASVLGTPVPSDPADALFGPAAPILNFVSQSVFDGHVVYFLAFDWVEACYLGYPTACDRQTRRVPGFDEPGPHC
jgi:hypothetical protein